MATSTVKPELPALKTPLTAPLSATYPSELRSPAVGTPTYIKREDAMKTPISPPAAYLDFLNKLSPTILSPQSAGAKFPLPEKPLLTSTTSSESIVTTSSTTSNATTATASNVTTSIAAVAESSKPDSPRSVPSRSSSCSVDSQNPDSIQSKPTPSAVPPSSFTRLPPARTPRRLHIPQSPYSPASVRSPMSAASVYSPYSSTMSPREWEADKQIPLSAGSTRAVSVRQVVTRTVTYSSRTPIVEPVPANKKRKIEN